MSEPRQAGSWHWIDDRQVRWRPRSFWKPGTQVTVRADIRSVPAGGGVYGQVDREIGFTVGERVVHRIDVRRHRLTTYLGGRAARTMPVSAGKPGFITRSGTKVVMEKHRG